MSKGKRAAISVALIVLTFLWFARACKPVDASAAVDTILLDTITTRYIFGDTISGGYLDNEGNFKSCIFEYSDLLTLSDSNLVNQGNYGGDSTTILLHYRAEVQNDIGQVLTDFQPICYLDLNATLENVTFFQWLAGAWVNGVWTTTNLSTLNTFAYMLSSAPALPVSSTGIGDGRYRTTFQENRYSSGKGAIFGANGTTKGFSGLFYSVSSASAGSLSLETVQFCCCSYYNGYIEIVFTCPYVNADVVIPSSVPSPSGSQSGIVSGTVGEQPISVDVDLELQYPDYFYEVENPPAAVDDGGFSDTADELLDESSRVIAEVDDGLEILGEQPTVPAWDALDRILSLFTGLKAIYVAMFLIALLGWKLYR